MKNKKYQFQILLSTDEITSISIKSELELKYSCKIKSIKPSEKPEGTLIKSADILIVDYEHQTKIIGYLLENNLSMSLICIVPEEKSDSLPDWNPDIKFCRVIKDENLLIALENCLRQLMQLRESEMRLRESETDLENCNG